MNLKESFRYHNFLDSMIEQLSYYLRSASNMMKVQETHLKSKANPDAQDEVIDATPERKIKGDNNKIIELLADLADEKFSLCAAVEEAKQGYKAVSFDAALAANKCRQSVANTLRNIASIKGQETIVQGKAYKINVEGNQTPYFYDVKSVSTIDFDRNQVKRLFRYFTEEADRVSDQIDHALLSTEVVFEPSFDMTESLEDIVESYCKEEE